MKNVKTYNGIPAGFKVYHEKEQKNGNTSVKAVLKTGDGVYIDMIFYQVSDYPFVISELAVNSINRWKLNQEREKYDDNRVLARLCLVPELKEIVIAIFHLWTEKLLDIKFVSGLVHKEEKSAQMRMEAKYYVAEQLKIDDKDVYLTEDEQQVKAEMIQRHREKMRAEAEARQEAEAAARKKQEEEQKEEKKKKIEAFKKSEKEKAVYAKEKENQQKKAETTILRRERIPMYKGSSDELYHNVPATEEEGYSLSVGKFFICVETYNKETGEYSGVRGLAVVNKGPAPQPKHGKKRRRKQRRHVRKDKHIHILPERVVLEQDRDQAKDGGTIKLESFPKETMMLHGNIVDITLCPNMDTVRAFNAQGLNSGTKLATTSSVKGKFEVYELHHGKISTVGVASPVIQ